MIAYLSGPVSLGGLADDGLIAQFSEVFMSAELLLSKYVDEVINPIDCPRQESWEDYMKIHIPSVCRSDLVVTLPEAERSRGSVLEQFIAHQLKIPVFSYQAIYTNPGLLR